jgi:hypothetical protein
VLLLHVPSWEAFPTMQCGTTCVMVESHNLVDVRRVFLPMLEVGGIVHYNGAIATIHYCLRAFDSNSFQLVPIPC